jgi:hypothetical protein
MWRFLVLLSLILLGKLVRRLRAGCVNRVLSSCPYVRRCNFRRNPFSKLKMVVRCKSDKGN